MPWGDFFMLKHSSLRELRKSKGMKIAELAKKLGLDESTVSNYEHGRRKPKLETIVNLADIFDISVSQAVSIFLSKKTS